MRIDIDQDDIEAIEDPVMKRVFMQLRENGFAVFNDDSINKRLSNSRVNKKYATNIIDLRDRKLLLMAPDRRTDVNIIAANPSYPNVENALSEAFGDIVRMLKHKR